MKEQLPPSPPGFVAPPHPGRVRVCLVWVLGWGGFLGMGSGFGVGVGVRVRVRVR